MFKNYIILFTLLFTQTLFATSTIFIDSFEDEETLHVTGWNFTPSDKNAGIHEGGSNGQDGNNFAFFSSNCGHCADQIYKDFDIKANAKYTVKVLAGYSGTNTNNNFTISNNQGQSHNTSITSGSLKEYTLILTPQSGATTMRISLDRGNLGSGTYFNFDYFRITEEIVEHSSSPTLIAEYRFDKCNLNSLTAEDSSGNNQHATVTGSVDTSSEAKIARSGHFKGGAVDATLSGLNTSNGAKTTVSFWMNWNGSEDSGGGQNWGQIPISWGNGENTYNIHIDLVTPNVPGSGLKIGFNTYNADNYGVSIGGYSSGWHHVVAIFENGNAEHCKLYIDGAEKSLSQSPGRSPINSRAHIGNKLRIGGLKNGDQPYAFKDYLDEVKIYNGELSSAEITTIYNNENSGKNHDGSNRNPVNCNGNSFTCSQDAYLFTGNPNVDAYTLNLSDGSYSSVKNNIPHRVNAVGYNVKDNYIWGYDIHTHKIIKIDADYQVTSYKIDQIPDKSYYAGDVSLDGILYIHAHNDEKIYKIDLNGETPSYDGTVTLTKNNLSAGDFAFNPIDGMLYTIHEDDKNLYKINISNGQVTSLGTTGLEAAVEFHTYVFDKTGNMYFYGIRGKIYKIDIGEGTSAPYNTTLFATTENKVSGGDGTRCPNAEVIQPPTLEGLCYAISDIQDKLYKVYVNPGVNPLPLATKIDIIGADIDGEGGAYNSADGLIYGFHEISSGPKLYSINPENGNTTLVNTLTGMKRNVTGASFYGGYFYIIAKTNSSDATLYKINTSDWSISSSTALNGDSKDGDALAINANGTAYIITDNNKKIYSIDIQTAHTTFVRQISTNTDAEGLSFAKDGNLYIENSENGSSNDTDKIYKIDLATGTLTPAAQIPHGDDIDIEGLSCNIVTPTVPPAQPTGCKYTFAGAISSTSDIISIGAQAKVYNNNESLITKSLSIGAQAKCDNGICTKTNTLAPTYDFNLELGNGNGDDFSTAAQSSQTISKSKEYSSIKTGAQSDLTLNGDLLLNIGNNFSIGAQSDIFINGDTVFKIGKDFTIGAQGSININGDVTIYADNLTLGAQAHVNIQEGTLTLIGNNIILGAQSNTQNINDIPDYIALAKNNLTIGAQGGINGVFYAANKAIIGAQAKITGAITAKTITLGAQAQTTYAEAVIDNFCNPPTCKAGANLVKNSSFENGTNNWEGNVDIFGGMYKIPDGNSYIRANNTNYQDILIEKGKKYKLTFYAGIGLGGSYKGQTVSMEYLCPAHKPKNIKIETSITNTMHPFDDFQEYTLNLPVAKGDATYIRISFNNANNSLIADKFDLRVDCDNHQRGFSITDASLGEEEASHNEKMKFKIVTNLVAPSGGLDIKYKIKNATALAGSDFTANINITHTAHINQGDTSVDIFIPIIDDDQLEDAEYLEVQLEPYTGAMMPDPIAIGYIIDNDMDPIPPTQAGSYKINDSGFTDQILRTKIVGSTPVITINAISGFSILHDRIRHTSQNCTTSCTCNPCGHQTCSTTCSTYVYYTDVNSNKMDIDEVILHYQDGTTVLLSGPRSISSGDAPYDIPLPITRATKSAWITVKGHSETVYGTGQSIELTATSDLFSMRPDKFEIDLSGYDGTSNPLKAGNNFNFKIYAKNIDGVTNTPHYNETINSNSDFTVSIIDTQYGTNTNYGLDLSGKSFHDGVLTASTTYSEAGELSIAVDENNTHPYATVDKADTSNNLKITPATTALRVIPDHFDLTYTTSNFNPTGLTYYATDLTESASYINTTITAQNKNNNPTFRYTNGGKYAKETILKVNLDSITTETTNPLQLNWEDNDLNLHLSGNIPFTTNSAQSFDLNITEDNFINAMLQTQIKINFTRTINKSFEPLRLKTTSLKITDSDSVTNTPSVFTNKYADYYYTRAHAPDQTTDKNILPAKIYYESYCKTCDKSIFTKVDTQESVDSVYWYQLSDYTNFDFSNPQPLINQDISISKASKKEITATVTKKPHNNKIIYTPLNFLIYNRFNASATTHKFNVNFSSLNTKWSGKGELGSKIDMNVSNKSQSIQQMDW